MMAAIEHGGDIRQAAALYGRAVDDWIDCSTTIRPEPYPLPAPPAAIWRDPPDADDGLEQIAAVVYGARALLAVPGAQSAIQVLPELRLARSGPARVGLVTPGYAEHRRQWARAGHVTLELAPGQVDAALDGLDVLVVVNPDSVTGTSIATATLHRWHMALQQRALQGRGGWLVVDETHADHAAGRSLCGVSGNAGLGGLIVLRSVGKFFGLAGVRLGFVFAAPDIRDGLADWFGPWAVAHPARWAGRLALADRVWQLHARAIAGDLVERLDDRLADAGLVVAGGTPLYRWCPEPDARRWQDALARRGVWVRCFDAPCGLRIGLPACSVNAPAWIVFERRLRDAACLMSGRGRTGGKKCDHESAPSPQPSPADAGEGAWPVLRSARRSGLLVPSPASAGEGGG